VEGYIDTIMGLIGICVGINTGILRVFKAESDARANVIPVDFVVNSLLAIARRSCQAKTVKRKAEIFNCVSPESQVWSAGTLYLCIIVQSILQIFTVQSAEKGKELIGVFPYKKMIWMPNLTITKSRFMYHVFFLLYHYVPAFFIDIVLRVKGSKIRLMKIYMKIYLFISDYDFFINHAWNFSSENMQKVYLSMNKTDHEEFPCVETGNFLERYSTILVNGTRKYFFKETDEDLVIARRNFKILKTVHRILWMTIYCSFAYFIMTRFNKPETLFFLKQ
jgi:alcohol-forming fatty acyl-CoA reductase